jgi:hypothetical protein
MSFEKWFKKKLYLPYSFHQMNEIEQELWEIALWDTWQRGVYEGSKFKNKKKGKQCES